MDKDKEIDKDKEKEKSKDKDKDKDILNNKNIYEQEDRLNVYILQGTQTTASSFINRTIVR